MGASLVSVGGVFPPNFKKQGFTNRESTLGPLQSILNDCGACNPTLFFLAARASFLKCFNCYASNLSRPEAAQKKNRQSLHKKNSKSPGNMSNILNPESRIRTPEPVKNPKEPYPAPWTRRSYRGTLSPGGAPSRLSPPEPDLAAAPLQLSAGGKPLKNTKSAGATSFRSFCLKRLFLRKAGARGTALVFFVNGNPGPI